MVNSETSAQQQTTSSEQTANTCVTIGCRQKSKTSHTYIPLCERINQRIECGGLPFFSIEFFPPKTKEAAINLIARFDRFRQLDPLFCDITWHSAGNPGGDSETSSITIAGVALNYCGLETILHITCIGLTKTELNLHLERAKNIGIRNILALRGDDDGNNKERHFYYAVDLIRYIRQLYGDYFTIAVAGYPTGHPEAISYEDDLENLKQKVVAGADFIVTQLFFDANIFIKFVNDCRNIGITVPILAGIMPIQSYDSFKKIVGLSKIMVPQELIDDLEPIKNNDEAIRKFGIDSAISLCRKLIESKITPGLHFYTLNRDYATTTIIKALGLCNGNIQRTLPWVAPANHRRCTEDVRPIFWASRQKSYVYRTNTWDDFPNGRWGRSDSPAFGDLRDYYLFLDQSKSKQSDLLAMWAKELRSEEDVWHIFYCYVSGSKNKNGKLVTKIPWNDDKLSAETELIADKLAYFNSRGILTINSQPNINGIGSSDPVHGWGIKNGYVYQKAYLEFFSCKKNVESLLTNLKNYPLVNYHIINNSGSEDYTNCDPNTPIAVTWGVFPGKEIIQPTVVDSISFKAWKDEAFSLWKNKWAELYSENSISRKVLNDVYENYYLINLVDNEFPKECCLWQLLEETLNNPKCETETDQTTNFVIDNNHIV